VRGERGGRERYTGVYKGTKGCKSTGTKAFTEGEKGKGKVEKRVEMLQSLVGERMSIVLLKSMVLVNDLYYYLQK